MAAFRRFIGRRGICTDIYSDCGTNFVKANRIINEHDCAGLLANEKITWHFNPPGAPYFGGLWEAAVKSIKTHLKRTLMNANLTYEELSTTTCQIEACVNSRPLIPITGDPEDQTLLTPGHFLIGRNLIASINTEASTESTPLKRWQYQQRLANQFWKQWSTEYLHSLQQRTKWQTKHENINVNDIIIMKDELTALTKWPLGRVTRTFPGTDKNTRCAEIKTQFGQYTRPITKICKLPISFAPDTTNHQ